MLIALDNVAPGLPAMKPTFGCEVKFYSNKVITDDEFETNISGLYVMVMEQY